MEINSIAKANTFKLSKQGKSEINRSFVDTLKGSLAKVNNLQHKSNKMGNDLALGKVDDVHDVMVAAQKAKLSLDLTTSITTKAVDAYQEVMRMQL
ncbi:flagellar hook-basal body complex protein FliE [Halonatronum saccharophilum]|uniref:flagellar hook-basal body complex protein FliE n=1 Tax=Halonatronum saccharophilum TaxID=150060 RepID=UPI00047F6CB5|nr:flagellar hook-basal body complex protein FliE [Halonatronum saccharophilum]